MTAQSVSFFTHVRGEIPGRSKYLVACDSLFPGNGKIGRYTRCECYVGSNSVKLENNNDPWLVTAARIGLLCSTFILCFYRVPKKAWLPPLLLTTSLFLSKVYFRWTTPLHICVPVTIPEAVKPTLNQLFGNVYKLPICHYDAVKQFQKLPHPIMKGMLPYNKPFIVVNVQCLSTPNAKATLLFKECRMGWSQFYGMGIKTPSFFPPDTEFTNQEGRCVEALKKEFESLKQFIKEGHCFDPLGDEWAIIGHTINFRPLILNLVNNRFHNIPTIGFDQPPLENAFMHPVMHYTTLHDYPGIAIKIRSREDQQIRTLVLRESFSDSNLYDVVGGPYFFDSASPLNVLHTKLQPHEIRLNNYLRLRQLIQQGSATDLDGKTWDLAIE